MRTTHGPASGTARALATVNLLLLGTACAAVLLGGGGSATAPADGSSLTVTSQAVTPAATVAGESTDHSFMYVSARQPVTFATCDVVRHRVNAQGAPKDGGQHVAEALRRIPP